MIDNSVIGELHMLTQSKLKELLHYDPETGLFIWLIKPRIGVKSGVVAGFTTVHGYIHIGIDLREYKAHRLAWLYVHGRWPKHQIDHINHIRDDNRLINLREATQQENNKNLSIRSDNTSGVAGVHWYKATSRWMTYIFVGGKRVFLGYFDDKLDAICARKSAEIKYDYHENHGR